MPYIPIITTAVHFPAGPPTIEEMTMTSYSTLRGDITRARTGTSTALRYAATALNGCPVGGWAETLQGYARVRDLLPARGRRRYNLRQFIDAAYVIELGRYRSALTFELGAR